MNCRDAKEQLDAIRPASQDRRAPEFADAIGHLADCSRCRTLFESRQRVDREIGRVMRDVPVPTGLRAGLLDALRDSDGLVGDSSGELTATSGDSLSAVDVAPPAQRRPVSRRRLLAACISVGVAAVVLGVMFWPPTPAVDPVLTLSDLRRKATLESSELQELPAFDGNFTAKLPVGVWQQRNRIKFDQPARGDLPDRDGRHQVALYGFRVGRWRGVLLVISKQRLEDAPANDQPVFNKDIPGNYAHRRASGTWHTFAWSEGDAVYVCFIPKRDGALEALKQLSPDPA